VSKKLSDKLRKVYDVIRTDLKVCITHNLDRIPYDTFSTMKDFIEDFQEVPRREKNISCNNLLSCILKKKEPPKTVPNHDFRSLGIELRKSLINFKKQLSASTNNEEKIETFFTLDKQFSIIYTGVDKKTENIFEAFNLNEKLKDEVDHYWEYFNITKIISKQTNKMKTQKIKMSAIEEAQMLRDCIICMESERNVIFRPCLHLICCETCGFGKIGNDCPECYTPIENKQIIFT
jgi:hypothetical protein